jgi:hypothetical protein
VVEKYIVVVAVAAAAAAAAVRILFRLRTMMRVCESIAHESCEERGRAKVQTKKLVYN